MSQNRTYWPPRRWCRRLPARWFTGHATALMYVNLDSAPIRRTIRSLWCPCSDHRAQQQPVSRHGLSAAGGSARRRVAQKRGLGFDPDRGSSEPRCSSVQCGFPPLVSLVSRVDAKLIFMASAWISSSQTTRPKYRLCLRRIASTRPTSRSITSGLSGRRTSSLARLRLPTSPSIWPRRRLPAIFAVPNHKHECCYSR